MHQNKSDFTSTKAHYLPFATQLTETTHISRFAGKTVGIDIFHWINKAIRAPPNSSMIERSPTSFLDPIYQKIQILRHYNITPVFVFDGWIVPKKLPQVLRRYRMRMEQQRKAMRYIDAATEISMYLQLMDQEGPINGQQMQQYDIIHEQPQEEPIIQDYIEAEITNIQGQVEHPQGFEGEQRIIDQSQSHQEGLEINNQEYIQNEVAATENADMPQTVMEMEPEVQPHATGMISQADVLNNLLIECEKLSSKGHRLLAQSTGLSEYNIKKTMQALLGLGYDNFIVAPYEADFQLVKLKTTGEIDFIISEDGDYIIHEVPTVYKLKPDGNCQFIDLSSHRNSQRLQHILPELKQFTQLSIVEKAEVAALCGTDYFKSVGAIIKTVVRRYIECKKDIVETIKTMRKEKAYMNKIEPDHYRHAMEVKTILLHQMVYDDDLKAIDYLHPFNQTTNGVTEQQLKQLVGPHYQYTDDIRTGKTKNRFPFVQRNLIAIAPPQYICLDVDALQEEQRKYKQRAKNGPIFKQSKQIGKKNTNQNKQSQRKTQVGNDKTKKNKRINKEKSSKDKKTEKAQSKVKPSRKTQLTKAAVGTKSILSFFKMKESTNSQEEAQKPGQQDNTVNQNQKLYNFTTSFIKQFTCYKYESIRIMKPQDTSVNKIKITIKNRNNNNE